MPPRQNLTPEYIIQFNQGLELFQARKYKDALEKYKEVVILKEDYVEAYYNIGLTLSALGRRDESQIEYRNVIERAPNHAKAYYKLGVDALAARNYQLAAEMFGAVVKLKPNASGYYNLALVVRASGSEKEALSALDAGLAIVAANDSLKQAMLLYKHSIEYTHKDYTALEQILSAIMLPEASTSISAGSVASDLLTKVQIVLDTRNNPEFLPDILVFVVHMYYLSASGEINIMLHKSFEAMIEAVGTTMVGTTNDTALYKIYKSSMKALQEIKDGAHQETLLHIAAREGWGNVITFLIDMGWENINCVAQGGITPLSTAMICEKQDCVQILLGNKYINLEAGIGGRKPIVIALKNLDTWGEIFDNYAPKHLADSEHLSEYKLPVLAEVIFALEESRPEDIQQKYDSHKTFLKLMGYSVHEFHDICQFE